MPPTPMHFCLQDYKTWGPLDDQVAPVMGLGSTNSEQQIFRVGILCACSHYTTASFPGTPRASECCCLLVLPCHARSEHNVFMEGPAFVPLFVDRCGYCLSACGCCRLGCLVLLPAFCVGFSCLPRHRRSCWWLTTATPTTPTMPTRPTTMPTTSTPPAPPSPPTRYYSYSYDS